MAIMAASGGGGIEGSHFNRGMLDFSQIQNRGSCLIGDRYFTEVVRSACYMGESDGCLCRMAGGFFGAPCDECENDLCVAKPFWEC